MKANLVAGLTFATALALTGCEAKDRETISREGGKAWEHAAKAASTSWDSLARKVSEITPESTKEAMDAARKAAEDAQKKLTEIPNPTPEVMKQIEGAKASLAKIDAAERLKDLQTRAGEMVESARAQAENAGKTADEIRQKLEGANASYQKLRKEINTARSNYEGTAMQVEKAMGR